MGKMNWILQEIEVPLSAAKQDARGYTKFILAGVFISIPSLFTSQ